MTSTATTIDYTAARERLASITTDPAALAGLDRVKATGELDGAFIAVVDEYRISLDWLFLGKGAARLAGCDG
jgi:hypothetical protein